jgi:hypothetical protein
MGTFGPLGVAQHDVRAVLITNGRVLLCHGDVGTGGVADPVWDLPGGPVDGGGDPGAALGRHVQAQLGAEVDLDGRAPDFRLTSAEHGRSLWLVRSWRGELSGAAPGTAERGWFAADEIGPLELADPRYLGVLSSVLAGGRARLTWSADGATVTKAVVPGVVVPHWASLLGTPRGAALNELRVNRMLLRAPPRVRAPKLLGSSRRGPAMTFEAVHGAPLGPKFPRSLSPADLDGLVGLAAAMGRFRPRRRWFRRLYIERRLALHQRSGLIAPADAEPLAGLAASVRWSFAHGDITARNVLRDAQGDLALIDWEWAGLYPVGYDLAFLWFSLVQVPEARPKVESAVPAHHRPGFLLSAAMVHLLHLQLWLRTPTPWSDRHEETLAGLLDAVRSRAVPGP